MGESLSFGAPRPSKAIAPLHHTRHGTNKKNYQLQQQKKIPSGYFFFFFA
jgi:hypothetical protein